MDKQLQKYTGGDGIDSQPAQNISVFFNPVKFDYFQRVAKLLQASSLLPDQFKTIPDIVIALDLAEQMRLNPFMLMRKMYVLNGKPGIETQVLISLLNNSNLFTALDYHFEGEGDDRACYASATRLSDGKVVKGPEASIKMAKAEGNFTNTKKTWMKTKWETRPDLMLRYNAASMFVSVHAPELRLGMQSDQEPPVDVVDTVDDVGDKRPETILESRLEYSITPEMEEVIEG